MVMPPMQVHTESVAWGCDTEVLRAEIARARQHRSHALSVLRASHAGRDAGARGVDGCAEALPAEAAAARQIARRLDEVRHRAQLREVGRSLAVVLDQVREVA